MRRLAAALVVVALAAAACGSSGGDATPTTSAPTPTTAAPATTTTTAPRVGTLGAVELATLEVGTLDNPIALAPRPGSPDLYIAEKGGRVRLIKAISTVISSTNTRISYQEQSTPLLDISGDVIDEGERGLLGMTFSTDGRKLYLDYTREPDGHTVVVEYELGDGTTIDRRSRRELLVVEQPFPNHNGGQLAFGPDGYLYIGLGDGGSGGDPNGNGQNTTALLGKILRIDPVAGTDAAYTIPPGNPFADGKAGAPQVWLLGVRNPWRFTFDRATGDLWVGDVGQQSYEEIDYLPATGGFDAGLGANLGWNEMEGTHSYEGGSNPSGGVLPIFEYGHDEGCAVIGGYVYRGTKIPGLVGSYLFADSCRAGVRGLQTDSLTVIDERGWDLPASGISSFGEDDAGEVYLLLADGSVLKITAP